MPYNSCGSTVFIPSTLQYDGEFNLLGSNNIKQAVLALHVLLETIQD